MELRYVLEGRPLSWKRVRGTGRTATNDRAMVAAKRSHAWTALAAMTLAQRARWDVGAEYELEVVIYLESRSGIGDVDNYAKLVQDALQGTVYRNDRQVVRLEVRRRIDPARPRTEVVVRTVSSEAA